MFDCISLLYSIYATGSCLVSWKGYLLIVSKAQFHRLISEIGEFRVGVVCGIGFTVETVTVTEAEVLGPTLLVAITE
ncbi:hypothetical protein NTGHW29_190013 [Candidatus Nitrotoga sp. HW29]|nr:hypothetical protein NTGHW29_190013 [Candidatus Nitrotoga sp. HW29]